MLLNEKLIVSKIVFVLNFQNLDSYLNFLLFLFSENLLERLGQLKTCYSVDGKMLDFSIKLMNNNTNVVNKIYMY